MNAGGSPARSPFETVLFRLLLLLVILAPLPLGSNRPWAWSLLGIGVGLMMVGWSVAASRDWLNATVPLRRMAVAASLFGAVIAWALLQGAGAVPESWWHPLWSEAATVLGVPVHGGLSLSPSLTMTGVLRLLTYGGVFWLAVQLCQNRDRARTALFVLAAANAAYALYGLSMHYLGVEKVLWFDKQAYLGDLTSTFVGRNAYGAYAGLGLLCMIALLLHVLRHRHTSRGLLAGFDETVMLRAVLALIGVCLTGTALLLSHSRGAFLSTTVAIGALLLLALMARLMRGKTLLLLTGVLTLIGSGMLLISGDEVLSRLAATNTDDARPALYSLSLQAISAAPWTGYGLGTFLPAFGIYRDTTLSSPLVWDFAHNTYLELAMDLGVVGAGLFYAAVAVVLGTCLQGVARRRRDHVYPVLAVSAATLLAAHGLVDFSAQIPAVAVTLAFLLGLGYTQSWSSAHHAEA